MTKGVKVALWSILVILIILTIVGVISYYQTPSTFESILFIIITPILGRITFSETYHK